MFHQPAPDTHARRAVRLDITRLKHLALFALALGELGRPSLMKIEIGTPGQPRP